jgi:glycine cleavage system aminomethyltransferase T
MSAMTAVLRRHGAVLVDREGRLVAGSFGSTPAEVAVCRTTVGLAERSDRATLEVQGPPAAVDDALDGLIPLGDRAWATRQTPGLALVRCGHQDARVCLDHLERSDRVEVVDVSHDHVAVELIGPLSAEVMDAAGIGTSDDPVVVVAGSGGPGIELLVPAAQGPALWNRLLAAGESYGISCVGLEALRHHEAYTHLCGPAPRG